MKRSHFITVLLLAIASLVLLVTVETLLTVNNYRSMRQQYEHQIESVFNEASHIYVNDRYTRSGTFSFGKIDRFRSIIEEELRRSGLTTPFSIEVAVTAGGDEISLMQSQCDGLGNRPITIENTINIITLRLTVKDPHEDILSGMVWNIALQGLSIVVLIIAFGYLLYSLFRAKSIDKIRRDLTHNITHELKTPIAASRAATEALRSIPHIANDAASRNEYLDITLSQLKRLERQVDEILRNSTEEFQTAALRLEGCNVEEMVVAIRSSLELNYASRNVEWRLNIEPSCMVVADRFHLEGALSALIDNAIKYTADPTIITIGAWCANGYTYISVRDNGPGIATSEQRRIFDKFYRAGGNNYKCSGYGLGLYYVKGVAQRHKGTITLTSSYGKGSQFLLKLPRYGK